MHASPMRKAHGRHNARLSTSWRDFISHSPRGIPCLHGTGLIRRTIRRLQMSVQKPVLSAPHGGETVTSSGGSSVERKVDSSQPGGEYGTVLLTARPGEEPPLSTQSRETELVDVA